MLKMLRKRVPAAAYAVVIAAAGGCASTERFEYGQEAFETHMARAAQGLPPQVAEAMLAGCAAKGTSGSTAIDPDVPPEPADPAAARVPPTRVFDNLYFLGDKNISVWALTTNEGIVLFDAHHDYQVEGTVIAGLEQLGLDPASIKYVVITHGHDDHYGGAKLLQQRYGARVAMGAADWNTKVDPNSRGANEPLPERDIAVRGVHKITLGEAQITLIPTPGHTPGTISALIPVTDHGEPHVAALVGGSHPFGSLPAMKQFASTIAKAKQIAADAGADVLLSNHPKNDGSLGLMKALAARKAGAPNPFVIGRDAFMQRITMAQECGLAWIANNGP